MLQRQHDGADHGDQQDHAGGLEEIDVFGIEHEPDRLVFDMLRRDRRGDRLRRCRAPITQAPTTSNSSARKIAPISSAERQILQHALLELGEVDIEHHHHEQEQHGDGADIDHDQDHRQELGAQHHEQAGGVDEGEDEIEHRMHRDCARRSP